MPWEHAGLFHANRDVESHLEAAQHSHGLRGWCKSLLPSLRKLGFKLPALLLAP